MKKKIYIDTSIVGDTLTMRFPVNFFEQLSFNEEAEELAQAYIEEKVVGKTAL